MSDQSFTRRSFLVATAATTAGALALRKLRAQAPAALQDHPSGSIGGFPLTTGWFIQSSKLVSATGDALSKPGASTTGWIPATVPTTVLAALVANGEYTDLFESDNLKKVPKDRFTNSWWYRTSFDIPKNASGPQTWLYFKGINYRANIWVNGKQIADSTKAVGAYRDLEFNITDALAGATTGTLAVEVFPPDKPDLTITFVDWAPAAPDANMGLWQEVSIAFSNPVAVRNPAVLADLDTATMKSADLTLLADLVNPTDQPITGELTVIINNKDAAQKQVCRITKSITLAARETESITLTPQDDPKLRFENPRIWWPAQLGTPELYTAYFIFSTRNEQCDTGIVDFGIRKFTSRVENKDGAHQLQFNVNGVDLLILGGGYAPDLLQRRDTPDNPTRQLDHLRYVRGMNLNTVRLEGKLEDDQFYDLCDQLGILVMPGWCCCSPWEGWGKWKEEQHTVAMESMRYQVRRARSHASILCFLNGSDHHPTEEIEKEYLAIEKELHLGVPTISSATAAESKVTGPSGVKMEGPYKWVPPIYWLTDKKKGGAHGFNTEVGPGPVPPPVETLERMLPENHRWPIDAVWNFHCGKGGFSNMNDFIKPLDARFGKSKSLADFAWKAQAQAYETIRAMYEGFRRNKLAGGLGTATGEIQWMLNNAWPSMIWHLYDYYMRPGAAYAATQRACEPLHILYSYDNHSIVVANDLREARTSLTATADIYDIHSKLVKSQTATLDSPPNSSKVAFTLEPPADISTTYFLRLTLKDKNSNPLSINSYFLSTKPDVLDYKAAGGEDWNITPCSSYADFTALETLPEANIKVSGWNIDTALPEPAGTVTVRNDGDNIALLVRLKLMLGEGANAREVLPILWDDNYFTLLPNETRVIGVRYRTNLKGSISIIADCFNNARA